MSVDEGQATREISAEDVLAGVVPIDNLTMTRRLQDGIEHIEPMHDGNYPYDAHNRITTTLTQALSTNPLPKMAMDFKVAAATADTTEPSPALNSNLKPFS